LARTHIRRAVNDSAKAPPRRNLGYAVNGSLLDHGLRLIGDYWSLNILRDAFLGVRQFEQFHESLGIPRQTLSERLRHLVVSGLFRVVQYQSNPVRHEYRLTEKGLALYPNVLATWIWSRKWDVSGDRLPRRLLHRRCGHRFVPECVCGHCHRPAGLRDVDPVISSKGGAVPAPARSRRWPSGRAQSGKVADRHRRLAFGASVDRWSLLIVATIYLGCHRFDEIQSALSLGTSVLAGRLAALCESGLLLRQPDLGDGRRFVYRLGPPGRDLFQHIVTLSAWVRAHHLNTPGTLSLRHRACGHAFRPEMVCSRCGEVLQAREVAFEA
jgi:DNA-binding HxlR family transcriptional regulator